MNNQPYNPNIQPQPVQPRINQPYPSYAPIPVSSPGGIPAPQMLPNSSKTIGLREINRAVPQHKGSSWGSVEYRPSHVRFATQNKGEKVYVLVRRHWITNISWIIRNLGYSLVPPIFIFILNLLNIEFNEVFTPKGIFLILLAFYSVIFTNLVKEFFDWYFDPYIVTNERMLSYEFKPFFSYTVTEAALENIEDVKETGASGIFQSIFNYGDIRILTASRTGQVMFKSVPKPTQIRDTILDLRNIVRKIQ